MVKSIYSFCTSKIRWFLRITNSGEPTNKPCETSRRRIPGRSPSPSLCQPVSPSQLAFLLLSLSLGPFPVISRVG